jgi:ankyrin repeat protein
MLLDGGADPNASYGRKTPLNALVHKCKRKNQGDVVEAVNQLLAAGVDPNYRRPGQKLEPALTLAAERDCPEVIRALVKGGAKLNIIDSKGWYPLDRAKALGRKDNVAVILELTGGEKPKGTVNVKSP